MQEEAEKAIAVAGDGRAGTKGGVVLIPPQMLVLVLVMVQIVVLMYSLFGADILFSPLKFYSISILITTNVVVQMIQVQLTGMKGFCLVALTSIHAQEIRYVKYPVSLRDNLTLEEDV
ncbi:hypothetical protein K435DRAFT_799494 [Dendrothele bispora CBS 962.96]|uniref:Uncharacterized protein n=1 Tax=Dendrothele bispora (strain CBS 962.96) TaxID=1314807 RepID=A0A4S8LW62_DENBC|nr:hypothetical protein K435DRAFT_799494 [Dendrothele bispora CBS 962.96]